MPVVMRYPCTLCGGRGPHGGPGHAYTTEGGPGGDEWPGAAAFAMDDVGWVVPAGEYDGGWVDGEWAGGHLSFEAGGSTESIPVPVRVLGRYRVRVRVVASPVDRLWAQSVEWRIVADDID